MTARAAPLDLRLVPAALTGWAVTAAVIGSGVPAALLVIAVGAAAAGMFGRLTGSAGRAAGIVTVMGLAFCAAGALRAAAVQDHPLRAAIGETVTVRASAADAARPLRGGRYLVPVDLRAVDGLAVGGRAVVFGAGPDWAGLTAGRPVEFRARVSRPRDRDLTIAVLTASGEPRVGTAGPLRRAADSVRSDLAAAARAVLPAREAALLPALVLGDTQALQPVAVAEFRTAGLTHLTAVSGANVTIVCATVLAAAVVVGPRVAVAAAGVALLAFVTVVGPGASVLRAAAMGAVTLLAIATHRRRQAIPALAASVLGLLVVLPGLALDAGFALSVSATAALVLVAPGWARRLEERGWPGMPAGALAVAAAAQVITAPLVAGISGTFSLVAVAANLLVAPVIPPVTVLGSVATLLAGWWPAGAHLVLRFTGPPLWWLAEVARFAARLPGAAVAVPDGAAGVVSVGLVTVVLLVACRYRHGRAAALVLAAALVVYSVVAGPATGSAVVGTS